MKSAKLIACAASVALLSVVGTAIGADDPKPTASPAQKVGSAEAAAVIRSLAGEWEGSIQTRNAEGIMSSSMASASCRLEEGGKRLACCYEGFAFGQAVEGAMLVTAPSNDRPGTVLSRGGASMKSNEKSAATAGAIVSSFEKSERGKTVKYEQVLKCPDAQRFSLELFTLDASNQRTLTMRLEMTRMAEGQKSAAAEMFDKSRSLADARGAMDGPIQQAGVPTE